MKKITLNPDAEVVKTVKEGLKRTGGYCPCRLERTEENKCMCKEFRDQINDPDFEGFATACYITNPNSHPALPDDRITWNKRKFIWRTSL